jgi:hypothetical protein
VEVEESVMNKNHKQHHQKSRKKPPMSIGNNQSDRGFMEGHGNAGSYRKKLISDQCYTDGRF